MSLIKETLMPLYVSLNFQSVVFLFGKEKDPGILYFVAFKLSTKGAPLLFAV
jgi:hypothetical protein